MKTLFIPVNSKLEIEKSNLLEISKKLPKRIAICYSVQYKKQAEQIKQILGHCQCFIRIFIMINFA